jgi:hypothetical protein
LHEADILLDPDRADGVTGDAPGLAFAQELVTKEPLRAKAILKEIKFNERKMVFRFMGYDQYG